VNTGHFFAFVGAVFAGIGAFLAVFHLVLATFCSASAADLGTETADFPGEIGAGGHQHGGRAADGGAIPIEGNAADHHFDVVFLQTGAGTMSTGDCAFVTSIDTALVIFVWHISFLV
jgi:hypothetical protein